VAESWQTPPYRLETERLVIRCWDPRDAPLLKDAVDSSLEDLRPWMPWAHDDPQPLAEKVLLLRRFRGRFDLGEDFVYGIFARDESEVIGGTGLHKRVGARAFEIGYWVRSSRVGNGFASEATSALTRIAFECSKIDMIEIHVDPANARSCRIPRKLGFTEEAVLRRRLPPRQPGGTAADKAIFSLFAEEYPSSPPATVPVKAFDGAGGRVL
jgi:RimJ/RimL family protein N-acetyltransferase